MAALDDALNSVKTELQSEIEKIQANLESEVARLEELIAINDYSSTILAQIAAIEEAYKAADLIINSSIAELIEADSTLAESITALESAYKAADEAIWQAIEALQATDGQLRADIDSNAIIMWVCLGIAILGLCSGVVGIVLAIRAKKRS